MANLNIPDRADPPAGRVGRRPHRPGHAPWPTARARSRRSPRSPAWKARSSRCRTSSCSRRPGVGAGGKVTGRFRATGIRPKCSDRLAAVGQPAADGHVRARADGGVRRRGLHVPDPVLVTFALVLGIIGARTTCSSSSRRRTSSRRFASGMKGARGAESKAAGGASLVRQDTPLSRFRSSTALLRGIERVSAPACSG